MALNLKAEQRNILKTFKTEEQYIIPAYQRPYSWDYELCSMMYDDILSAYQKKEEYFLGTIITSSDDTNKNQFMIIDGQQRLTTILLFIKIFYIYMPLKPLKDILEKENWKTGKLEDRIISKVFESNDTQELQNVLKMTKEDFEDKYEKCLILKGKNKGKFSEKNCENKFIANSMYFYDWIKFYNENNNDLEELIFFFLESIFLLPIELSGKDEKEAKEKALKIFETMNNRGLSLNDTDIFKAYLYDKAERLNEEDIFKSQWSELKDNCKLLNTEVIDIFRYYSHIIRGNNKKTSSEINLREFFTKAEYSPFILENYKTILNDLFKIIDILKYIKIKKQENTELAKWLQLIEIYTNQYPKTLLIVYLFHNPQLTDSRQTIDFLKSVVRFTYYQGSTTRIKYEIYNMIKQVSFNEIIDTYIETEASENELLRLGLLKNGYALLHFYLNNNDTLNHVNVIKIIKFKDRLLLNSTWENIDISSIENRLGNLKVNNFKTEETSIEDYNYDLFEDIDLKQRKLLVEFFKGNI